MKAAVVSAPGIAPAYADFRDPEPEARQVIVRVAASALSHVARSRAAGSHYSGSGGFPFVAGVDGTGVRERDGQRVYFLLPPAPFGAMAERCVVDETHVLPLPEGLDDVVAAAIAIPGMSSWAALTERARIGAGETVLVNGATGTSGRLAVAIARLLGAGRVIATGRNPDVLAQLGGEGADAVVPLTDDEEALERSLRREFGIAGIDVVLDYLWGTSAERTIVAAAKSSRDGHPIRFVHIGAASAPTLTLPSRALRSSTLQLLGSGIGSIAFPDLLKAIRAVLDAAALQRLRVTTTACPLRDVAMYWTRETKGSRLVLEV